MYPHDSLRFVACTTQLKKFGFTRVCRSVLFHQMSEIINFNLFQPKCSRKNAKGHACMNHCIRTLMQNAKRRTFRCNGAHIQTSGLEIVFDLHLTLPCLKVLANWVN